MSADTDRIGSGSKSADQQLDPASNPSADAVAKTADAEARSPQRKQLKSKKLDRTLQELEKAFSSWESLSGAKAAPVATDERRKAQSTPNEQEFRNKTRKLLTQLRQQLADLSDEPTNEE